MPQNGNHGRSWREGVVVSRRRPRVDIHVGQTSGRDTVEFGLRQLEEKGGAHKAEKEEDLHGRRDTYTKKINYFRQ
jgi:hypothetical protein